MANILVTGGLGYIGSHTVVELQKQNHNVFILDNLSNSEKSVLEGITKISGIKPQFFCIDVTNETDVTNFFTQNSKIDAVIHFAASKAVGESVAKSLEYYHNNVWGLINLLMCMRKFNVPHFVFSSSCTVYGQPDVLPVTENAPLKKAESPYGNTKKMCEDIIQHAIESYHDFTAIMLRYFNPIGAHETALIGELPKGVPNNLVPFITQTAAGLRKELSVFGNNYNTPDGSAIRDYIYVCDLAKAHVIAVERLLNSSNKEECEVFNLGTGTGVSVLEIVTTFIKATGVNVPYKIVERRPGDIEQVWANTSFANTELQWSANTPLQTILWSAWQWEKHIRGLQ